MAVDPSALIFIALALAWAGYLIPRALEHHEESVRSRSIDRFSKGLRILARREPRGRRRSELVTVAAPPVPDPEPEAVTILVPVVLTPTQQRARRRAQAVAAHRRRRILDLLLLANVVVAALALLAVLAWHWQAVPAGLVVLWLVMCRLSVRRERRPVMERRELDPVAVAVDPEVSHVAASFDRDDVTEEIARIVAEPAALEDPAPAPAPAAAGGWDLQPVVVPTYVAKEQARRSVRTIDLDSTGVWSSGRSAADSALVRDQEASAVEPPAAAASGE